MNYPLVILCIIGVLGMSFLTYYLGKKTEKENKLHELLHSKLTEEPEDEEPEVKYIYQTKYVPVAYPVRRFSQSRRRHHKRK